MKNNEATDTTQAAGVAEQGAHFAPEKVPSTKGASQKKGMPKGQKTAKGAKVKAGKKAAKPARTKEAGAPRAESKGAKIIEMIGRASMAHFDLSAQIHPATKVSITTLWGFSDQTVF